MSAAVAAAAFIGVLVVAVGGALFGAAMVDAMDQDYGLSGVVYGLLCLALWWVAIALFIVTVRGLAGAP